MKIENEDIIQTKNPNSGKKITTLVSALIAITLVIVIGIIVLIMNMQGKKLSVTIDGVKTSVNPDVFMFTENNDDVYVSIRDIATLVGYEAHNRRI